MNYKKILILGYGLEGKSTHNFLRKKFPNKAITISDQNEKIFSPDKNTKLQTGKNYLKNLDKFDLIIKSAGIPLLPELQICKNKITSATQLFFQEIDASNRVIAITGSKGKSTVSSSIFHVLKSENLSVKLLGNIGNPMLKFAHEKNKIFIIELSSYQLENLNFSPNIAIWTSFFPDHLDYHNGIDNYFNAKTFITKNQTKDRKFIFHKKYYEKLFQIKTKAEQKIITTKKIETKLIGKHNLENISLAYAACRELNIPVEKIKTHLKTFNPLPHRLENIGRINNKIWIDDAISTTPESTIAAINSLGKNLKTILLGGTDRGYEFTELINILEKNKIKNIVLFPDTGTNIKNLIDQNPNYNPNIFQTISIHEAVKWCDIQTQKNKIILLSTASPSYSLWKNFIEKGNKFQNSIKKIAQ